MGIIVILASMIFNARAFQLKRLASAGLILVLALVPQWRIGGGIP
jgi:hypothetical protein